MQQQQQQQQQQLGIRSCSSSSSSSGSRSSSGSSGGSSSSSGGGGGSGSSSRSISRAAGSARQASTAHAVLFYREPKRASVLPYPAARPAPAGAAHGQAGVSQSLVIRMSIRACHFNARPQKTQPNSSRVGRTVSLESTFQPRTMPANRTRPCRGSTPRSDLRSTASFTVMKPGSEPSGCCSVVRSWVPIFHCGAGQQGGKGFGGKVGHAAHIRQSVRDPGSHVHRLHCTLLGDTLMYTKPHPPTSLSMPTHTCRQNQ